MAEYTLLPHPDFPSVAASAVRVAAARQRGALTLTFAVEGDLDNVAWPAPLDTVRADELWKHTCFEAFVQPEGRSAYTELNFSPSGRWAAYSFDAQRENMRDLDPAFEVFGGMAAGGWEQHSVTWRFWTFDVLGNESWRAGLTAVIEAKDGSKSYWALAHAPGPPDFHNADCFIATLPAPGRA